MNKPELEEKEDNKRRRLIKVEEHKVKEAVQIPLLVKKLGEGVRDKFGEYTIWRNRKGWRVNIVMVNIVSKYPNGKYHKYEEWKYVLEDGWGSCGVGNSFIVFPQELSAEPPKSWFLEKFPECGMKRFVGKRMKNNVNCFGSTKVWYQVLSTFNTQFSWIRKHDFLVYVFKKRVCWLQEGFYFHSLSFSSTSPSF